MNNTVSKFICVMCSMVLMLALSASINSISVLAASNGIYLADATPHYKHPTTGKIEDSGGESSATLGQSMTESATYKKALVEVTSSGTTYITVRLQLMDNIQNPKFQVDGKRNGSFSSVSASLMQEDYSNNTADYRMKVPDEKAVIRCNMYVVPMGREVIFYITVSDLKSGSGDFITSISVDQPKAAQSSKKVTTKKAVQTTTASKKVKSKKTVTTKKATAAQNTVSTKNSVQSQTSAQGQVKPKTSEASSANAKKQASVTSVSTENSSSATQSSQLSETESAAGLQEFNASGVEVSESAQEEKDSDDNGSSAIWWVVGGIIVIAVAAVCVWYFRFFRKKK